MIYKLFISISMVILMAIAISLSSCKSKTQVPPVISPPVASPGTGIPTAGPPASSSGASLPGSGIPDAGLPDAGGQQPSDQGGNSRAAGTSGEPASKSKARREAAGDDLRESGEMIARSGARLGTRATAGETDAAIPAPEFPQEYDQGTQGEPDTLPPESDSVVDGTVYTPSDTQSSEVSAIPSDLPPDILSDILSATEGAREALETAGDALLTAGDAVAGAVSDEELAEAEAQLADARISVIIAEQEIGALRDSPYYEDDTALLETEAALEQANVVLVIATRAILKARTGMPDFPATAPAQAIPASSEVAALEDELEGSLEIFDDRMNKARGVVIATAGGPILTPAAMPAPEAASDQSEGGIIGNRRPGDEEESPTTGSEEKSVEVAAHAEVPEGIPSAQGDDIVAQQLREAAIAETNPALKEKLWIEYKRYKAGL